MHGLRGSTTGKRKFGRGGRGMEWTGGGGDLIFGRVYGLLGCAVGSLAGMVEKDSWGVGFAWKSPGGDEAAQKRTWAPGLGAGRTRSGGGDWR